MPGPYGVTATGFNPKPLQEIKTDLEAAFRVAFGNGVDLSADTIFGQLIGIFSDRLADAWQGIQGAYNAAFPDTASGVALDRISALTGIARKPATKSQVTVTVTGTPGTVIPVGFTVSVAGAGTKFQNVAGSYTIPAGGSIGFNFQAVDDGPLLAPAGTVTVIETPTAGVAAVNNAFDQFILGSYLEADGALRLRRELSLRAIGSASVEAIKAGVAEIADVTSVGVYENTTDATVDGVPPHAFETIVNGGLDAAIAQVIFDRKPAGIVCHGSVTVVVNDSFGGPHDIKFSRPTAIPVYVALTVTVDGRASSTVDQLIKDAVALWGDLNLNVGDDLIAQAIVPTVFGAAKGIVDCTVPKIGLTASPTLSTTIQATPRQILELDTARITVTVNRV